MKHLNASSCLLALSVAILAFSLGRFVYHYVLFEAPLVLLLDF